MLVPTAVLHPIPAALGDRAARERFVAEIRRLREEGTRVVVVVAALERAVVELDGVLGAAVSARHEVPLAAFQARYRDFGAALGVDADRVLAAEVAELARHALSASVMAGVRPATHARVRALAHQMAATLVCAWLGRELGDIELIDPRPLVRALPPQAARDVLAGLLAPPQVDPELLPRAGLVVLPGGVAGGPHDDTVVLAGDGGALSAAAVAVRAAAPGVDVFVDGVGLHTADPELVRSSRRVEELHPGEARELGALGVAGLAPPAVDLLANHQLELRLRADDGDLVVSSDVEAPPGPRLLHVRWGVHVVAVEPAGRPAAALGELLLLAQDHGVAVERVACGMTGVTLAFSEADDAPGFTQALSRLGPTARLGPCVAVTLVGSTVRSVWHHVGVALEAVGRPRLRMVVEGADDRSLALMVDEAVAEPLVRALHGRLYAGTPTPEAPVDSAD